MRRCISAAVDEMLDMLMLAMAVLAVGCATVVSVREWRAPRLLAIQLDPSCHLTDPVHLTVDRTVVYRGVMGPRDSYEMTVTDGTHIVSARVLGLDSAHAWAWPTTRVIVPAGERYIDLLTCN